MGSFVLGEVGEYIPQNVVENDFLNQRLESETYGIYYSVKFEGDAETFLLQAKKPPVEGQAEWGMIEESKSGKSMRFKRVKREDSVGGSGTISSSPTKSDAYLKDISNTPILMYNGSLHYAKDIGLNLIDNKEDRRKYYEYIKDATDEVLMMVDNIRGSGKEAPAPAPIKQPSAAAGYDKTRQTASRIGGTNVTGEHDYGDEPFNE